VVFFIKSKVLDFASLTPKPHATQQSTHMIEDDFIRADQITAVSCQKLTKKSFNEIPYELC
jgi:hypothetical protein